MQSSYLQTNKAKKKRFDDAGYEETPIHQKNKKKKKDFSNQRKAKRGEE
jgi:hypothetical protein